jgi:hypothetical protein
LQPTLSVDFSKTVQRAPIKKTSPNQQHRKVVVVAAATHSLHNSCNNQTVMLQKEITLLKS